jgi:hypothetical protein
MRQLVLVTTDRSSDADGRRIVGASVAGRRDNPDRRMDVGVAPTTQCALHDVGALLRTGAAYFFDPLTPRNDERTGRHGAC